MKEIQLQYRTGSAAGHHTQPFRDREIQLQAGHLNYFPVVRFAYNFSRSRSLNINYSGNTTQPSFSQLQPVPDYSNQLYVTIGNPDLSRNSPTASTCVTIILILSAAMYFRKSSVFLYERQDRDQHDPRGRAWPAGDALPEQQRFYTASGFYNVSSPSGTANMYSTWEERSRITITCLI